MNKINSIFLFVLLSFCLLTNISFALPDFYAYQNFYLGQSPYSIASMEPDLDNGYFEEYNPVQNFIGFVSSFSDKSMSGASPSSAVPSYDMDLYVGKNLGIQPGEAIVVYSGSGEYDSYFMQTGGCYSLFLGTTSVVPLDFTQGSFGTGTNYQLYSDSFVRTSDKFFNYTNYFSTNWTSTDKYTTWSSEQYLRGFYMQKTNQNYNVNTLYSFSRVFLVYNPTNSVKYVYVSGYSGPSVNVEGISFNNIKWIVSNQATTKTIDKNSVITGNVSYLIPFIKGDFDLYSLQWSNNGNSVYYMYGTHFPFSVTFDFSSAVSSGTFTVKSDLNFSPSFNKKQIFVELSSLSLGNGYAPIFLHQYNATRYIDGKAIYIYDGYISIQNYDELISKLKENGVGSTDLSRVLELLDEINSGGATGAEVKELIDTIENLENDIFSNLDTTDFFSSWDTYKSLLDFSSLNWLIVSNNRMFEIFAGIIVLAVIFITCDRVMR